MMFPNLEKELIKEIESSYAEDLKAIESEEGLKQLLKWRGKQYKGNERKKFAAYLEKTKEKKIKEALAELAEVGDAEEFEGELVIYVEWTKSRMWGNNPRATTNTDYNGKSIGGYGYDKESTATAGALNNDKRILKVLYAMKEKELNNRKPFYTEQNGREENSERAINQFLYGYGSGYSILPHFEGGVGVSCHWRILEKAGFKVKAYKDGVACSVYAITRVEK